MNIRQALYHPFPEAPAPGQAIAVAPGVLWLRLPLPIVLNHVNVYALEDGDGWTIIDTGSDTPETRAAWEQAMAGPLAGRPVRRVIVTHHHPDHVGLAGWFMARGAELWMTQVAWLTARMLMLDAQTVPAAETVTFWRHAGMPEPLIAARMAERPFNMSDATHPLPLGFHRISAGDVLRIGGRDWTVHTGGGHAPDQATLWSDDGLVLAADQVLPGITPNVGVYATEPEADPLADWLAACLRMEAMATPRQVVLPGHQLPFTGLPERLAQLQANHHDALDKLMIALAEEPRTACACFPLLFRRQIGPALYGMALVEAMAHVNHLWHLGRITRETSPEGAWLWRAAA